MDSHQCRRGPSRVVDTPPSATSAHCTPVCRSTAPCEIPDCQGDSYGYQGLPLPTGALPCALEGKLFYNLWINYQPREEWYLRRQRVSCVLLLRQCRSCVLCRCLVCGLSSVWSSAWQPGNVLSWVVKQPEMYVVVVYLRSHSQGRAKGLLLRGFYPECVWVFLRTDLGTRPLLPRLPVWEKKGFQLHLNALELRSHRHAAPHRGEVNRVPSFPASASS